MLSILIFISFAAGTFWSVQQMKGTILFVSDTAQSPHRS